MDLPISEPGLGAADYARAVDEAIPAGVAPVLVGHSMGGLVIALVAARRPIRRLVFLTAFIPSPGRSANEQRAAEPIDGRVPLTTAEFTDLGDDVWMVGPATATELFFYDAPAEVAAWATGRLRPQCYRVMSEPSPLEAWPARAGQQHHLPRRPRPEPRLGADRRARSSGHPTGRARRRPLALPHPPGRAGGGPPLAGLIAKPWLTAFACSDHSDGGTSGLGRRSLHAAAPTSADPAEGRRFCRVMQTTADECQALRRCRRWTQTSGLS